MARNPANESANGSTPEILPFDALTPITRSNPQLQARKSQYEDALSTLVAGGDARVWRIQGKDNPRGIKLRITYAAKRLGIVDSLDIGDAKLPDGTPVVYARIPAAS